VRLPELLLAVALISPAFAQSTSQDPPQPLPDPASAPSQTPPSQTVPSQTAPSSDVQTMEETPTFRVNVVERTARAVNYRARGGATKINFKGTELLPKSNGEAKVESKRGYTEIEVEFDDLSRPTQFGNEYLTYVLWAVTPEGRAKNLGELVMSGNRGKLNVTTELQAFGMIVTAEPYYGVTQPSNLVVLENVIRPDTVGKVEVINTKYSLIERGGYRPANYTFEPMVPKPNLPAEFYQAQNAMRIAKAQGADRYAESTYDRAARLYQQAVDYANRKNVERKAIVTVAREAVQTFEDARLISLRRQEEERQENERRAAAEREASAKAIAVHEAERRTLAEQEAADAARRRQEAEEMAARQREDAERSAQARAEAEAARQAALTQQQQAEELARLRSAEADRQRAAAEEAERLRSQAEREKEELRARLLQQFNLILETRDTARGLVVNLSDVLFDFGKSTLRPQAREKLAKLSGILLAYPGLNIQVEGHTDNIGSEAYNQKLSEQRAEGVLAYITKQGVPPANVTAIGLGKSQPVADNRTAAGRQQNRRVEMIVSGEVIGTKIGPSGMQQPSTQQVPPQQPPPSPR
jgi:outer membrane protein OmpA-like peptidoglycan-associated protein